MYLRYGTFAFPPDSCEVTRAGEAVSNDAGLPVAMAWRYDVTCYLRSDQPAALARQKDLTAQEFAVRAALSVPLRDLVFCADDGTPTDMALVNFGSLGGVAVTAFANPAGGQAEYAGNRTLRFSATATYPLNGTAGVLLSFEETVTAVGTGGPVVRNRLALDGTAVRQQLYPVSLCRASQAGRAVGFVRELGPADAPPPLWPRDELWDQRQVAVGSPARTAFGYTRFPLSWAYAFERAGVPFVGRPNRWV